MKKYLLLTLGSAGLLAPGPVLYAEAATPLDSIVVTADRKARTVDETLAPVTVITRADIERYQATDVADVLRHVPGLTLKNEGGAGQTTSVFLRGTNSGHVLVLVDGIRVGSATTGLTTFQHLPLSQIERIEVVRGPRSSLYGSEAIGGVIQIMTRKGGKGFRPEVTVTAGSHQNHQASVNLAGGDQTTWFNLNAASQQTEGMDVCRDANACFALPLEPDADGYRQHSASLRAGHKFASGASLEGALSQVKGKVQYDGSFQDQSEIVQQTARLSLRHPLSPRTVITAQAGQFQDKSDNFKEDAFASRFDTYRDMASVQLDHQAGENASVTLGIDQQRNKVSSDTAYARTASDNTGLFASYQRTLGKTAVDVSMRNDHSDDWGDHATGNVAVGHELGKGMRVNAAYGTAFKAPTFNDLYAPFGGNAALAPEQSRNGELGIYSQWPAARGNWALNVFDNRIDNLISFPPPTYTATQTGMARIRGLEATAATRWSDWDVNASMTLQQPENRSGTDAGKTLVYRPQQSARVDVDRSIGKLRVGATLRGEGKRYHDAANTQKLPGYGTLDVRADYRLAKNWLIGAKLSNVLDKSYETSKGYRQDGINGLVTLKYAPD